MSQPPYTQEIISVDIASGQESVILRSDETAYLWPVNWSPDGRYFYSLRGTNPPELWRTPMKPAGTAEPVQRIEGANITGCNALSADGAYVLCGALVPSSPRNYYAVLLVPTDGTEGQVLASGANDSPYSPIWRPDGKEITIFQPAGGSSPAGLQNVNVSTHAIRSIPVPVPVTMLPTSWSPDGQWLALHACCNDYGGLFLLKADGSDFHRLTNGKVSVLGWLTDGSFTTGR